MIKCFENILCWAYKLEESSKDHESRDQIHQLRQEGPKDSRWQYKEASEEDPSSILWRLTCAGPGGCEAGRGGPVVRPHDRLPQRVADETLTLRDANLLDAVIVKVATMMRFLLLPVWQSEEVNGERPDIRIQSLGDPTAVL
ncbi:unnamed protein product [Merluccius merluccius]